MSVDALAVWVLLMGPVAGSFVTALADRHCAGQPLLAPRSRCAACRQALAARDLVPLLSWPLLRGRCRTCGAPIPPHLWAGEWAGLALAAAAVAVAADARLPVAAAWLWLLLGLFQADRRCGRLPDALTLPLLLAGAALGALANGAAATLLAAAAGPGALWLLARAYRRNRGREGLGLGDVKMMAGLAAAVGPLALPWLTLLAALSALGTALLWRGGAAAAGPGGGRIAFGCHLALAGGLVWLAGELGRL